uniref:C-C motif chemokine ligand 25 n=2 Tax=Mus musculus TaxID=10090 RepID=F7C0M8_MOUSE
MAAERCTFAYQVGPVAFHGFSSPTLPLDHEEAEGKSSGFHLQWFLKGQEEKQQTLSPGSWLHIPNQNITFFPVLWLQTVLLEWLSFRITHCPTESVPFQTGSWLKEFAAKLDDLTLIPSSTDSAKLPPDHHGSHVPSLPNKYNFKS